MNWQFENGVLTISGEGKMKDFCDKVEIEKRNWELPSYHKTYCYVYSIKKGDERFCLQYTNSYLDILDKVSVKSTPWDKVADGITKIVIEEGVESIGNGVFTGYYPILESIELPSTLKTIGDLAFYGCRNVSSITLPGSIKKIGNFAFNNLKKVEMEEGLESFSETAFDCCKDSLEGIVLPSSLGYVPDSAFAHFSKLGYVSMGDKIEHIGNEAFSYCYSLTTVTLGNKLKSIGKKAFCDCNLESIVIPESVETIGDGAFIGCPINTVTVPSSVTSVGKNAFPDDCKVIRLYDFIGGTF